MTMYTGGDPGQTPGSGGRRAATRQPRRSSGAAPRSRLQVDERRAQLLELGARLFSEHSYDGLSVDDIAKAAGISKGLLYHYFPSKRDFYVETIRAAAHQLLEETESASEADPASSPLERARQGVGAYLDYAERHASAFAALLRGGIGSDREVFDIIEGVRHVYVDRFLSKAPIGEPTPFVRTAIRGYIGYAEGVVLDWLEHKDVDKAELQELLTGMIEHTVMTVVARQGKKPQASK
jgi:AcrR family transcriptional regulator